MFTELSLFIDDSGLIGRVDSLIAQVYEIVYVTLGVAEQRVHTQEVHGGQSVELVISVKFCDCGKLN
jgi:hypothetical protein